MQLRHLWDKLSPPTKVLLYLQTVKEVRMWGGNKTGPEDTTQKGMANALGISVSRLSKLLGLLSREGCIQTERVRIPGLRRRPLAYSLSGAGTNRSHQEMNRILSKEVRFTSLDGSTMETSLGGLCRALAMEGNLVGLLKSTPETGGLDAKALQAGGREGKALKVPRLELVDLRDAIQISSHFVGRKKELAELNDFLTTSPARLFTLIGPAAIGKTSLVSRFVMNAMKSVSVAFHICREWDTLRNVLEPIAELLARMGRRRLQYMLRSELRPIAIQDAAGVLKKDLGGVAALVIFDDIQKLPFDYRPLLKLFLTSMALEEAPGSPGPPGLVKVVTTSREPIVGVFDHRELIVKELVKEMELRGLTENETRELLQKENAKGLPPEKIHQMTGGHPLYIELITRSGLSGAVRDFRKFVGTEVMGRLTPDERAVLGCLTVFRMPVPYQALQIPQSTPEILDRLAKLGLVNETAPEEYQALDIVVETFYRSLKNEEKRLYHAAAAKYLRGLRTEESVAEAIHHLMAASDILAALELASENVRPLIRLGHSGLLEKVLEASKEEELPTRGIVASCKLRSELALAAGEWRIAQIHLEKALAAVKGDDFQEGAILMAQAEALRMQALLEEALGKYFEAEKSAKRVYDLPTLAGVYRGVGNLYWRMGDFDKALEFLKKSLDFLKAAEMGAEYGETLTDLGVVHSRLGNSDKAIEYYNRAIEELKKGSWVFSLGRAYNNLGVEYLERKELKEAIRVWNKSIDIWKEVGNKHGLVITMSNISDPYSQLKKFQKAKKCLDMAMGIVNETDDAIARAQVLSNYGQVYAKMKRWKEAFRNFEESIAISKDLDNHYDYAFTLYEYGKALVLANSTDEAAAQLTRSLELFQKCDAKTRVKEVKDLLRRIGPRKRSG